MLAYLWPLALIVVSNTMYQICAKSLPGDVDPLASLTITYLVGAAASAVLYFALNRGGNLLREYAHMNWAPYVLGVVIVGLEVGTIYAYKAGWPVSSLQIVQAAVLAAILVVIGYALYHESITVSKAAGIVLCLGGLYFINR